MEKLFGNKKFLAVLISVVVVLVIGTLAWAGQAGVFNKQNNGVSGAATLWSAATGTTSAYTTNYATFDYPMNNVVCDVMMTPYSAGTLTFTVNGNGGTSATSFPATPYLVTTATLSASSATNNIAVVKATATPFRTIVATITAPTTTAVVTVNCSANQ